MNPDEEKKRLDMVMPAKLHKQIRVHGAENHLSMGEVMREAIKAYLHN